MFRKCPDCKKKKFLTKHSKTGNHKPPFIYLCRDCHDKRDGISPPKPKYNKKYQPGTIRMHKKRWKKKRK